MPRKKLPKEQKAKRARNWGFIMYEEPTKMIDSLTKQFEELHWAWALHDKDRYDFGENAGELKKPHYHVLINFGKEQSETEFKKENKEYLFSMLKQNITWEVINDRILAFEYLWHKNNPEKYQYKKDIVQTREWRWWYPQSREEEKRNIAWEILQDMLKGEINGYQMVQKYGMAYVAHREQIEAIIKIEQRKEYNLLYDLTTYGEQVEFDFIDSTKE